MNVLIEIINFYQNIYENSKLIVNFFLLIVFSINYYLFCFASKNKFS